MPDYNWEHQGFMRSLNPDAEQRRCDECTAMLRIAKSHIEARLKQHSDNLHLWLSEALTPTEPEEEERAAVIRELRAAIVELQGIAQVLDVEYSGRSEN